VRVSAAHEHKVHLWASVGEVSAPRETETGVFEASYRAPLHGVPGYAAVVAWDESSGEVTAAIVALSARVEIPVRTEPGAQVTVSIAGRHAVTTADDKGHARVTLPVPPGVRRARVTATDAAGNTNVTEVVLDIPRARGLWLLAPDGALDGRRIYVVSMGQSPPRLSAGPGARLKDVDVRRGVGTAVVEGGGPAVITAANEEETVSLSMSAPPYERLTGPRLELGASVAAQFSGSFAGVALLVEGRMRVKRSPVRVGLDLVGLYASGSAASFAVQAGGFAVHLVGEARVGVSSRVALGITARLGGAVVADSRTRLGRTTDATDGGPTVAIEGGLLARLGPGLLTLSLGFSYTPLIGLESTNLEGGVIAAGYRTAKW
jgi:hypothetical protein